MKNIEEKRIREIINKHLKSIPEDLKKHQMQLGIVLSQQSKLSSDINKEATMVNLYRRRMNAILKLSRKKYVDMNTFYSEFIDKYYTKWDKVSYSKSLLNINTILGYLQNKISFSDFIQINDILEKYKK